MTGWKMLEIQILNDFDRFCTCKLWRAASPATPVHSISSHWCSKLKALGRRRMAVDTRVTPEAQRPGTWVGFCANTKIKVDRWASVHAHHVCEIPGHLCAVDRWEWPEWVSIVFQLNRSQRKETVKLNINGTWKHTEVWAAWHPLAFPSVTASRLVLKLFVTIMCCLVPELVWSLRRASPSS